MGKLRRVVERFREARKLFRLLGQSESCRAERVELRYPAKPWYRENAAGMVQAVDQACRRLTRVLGLDLPAGATCVVLTPEDADAIQGNRGVASGDNAFIVVPERQLSGLAGVAAHEIAHVLSHPIGPYERPFKGEGFACFAASAAGMDPTPFGLRVHQHTAWLLARGVRPSISDLWQRSDYSPELYDLAWSFAAYLFARFGRERYFHFYASKESPLEIRFQGAFGEGVGSIERGWHEYVRRHVPVEDASVLLARRRHAILRSRAHWLHEGSRNCVPCRKRASLREPPGNGGETNGTRVANRSRIPDRSWASRRFMRGGAGARGGCYAIGGRPPDPGELPETRGGGAGTLHPGVRRQDRAGRGYLLGLGAPGPRAPGRLPAHR